MQLSISDLLFCSFLISFIFFVPYIEYFHALDVIETKPKIISIAISEKGKKAIWLKYSGIGKPRIDPITPWKYIDFIICNNQTPIQE